MEAFVVSALKYRPTTFEEVVGQESITQTLKNSLQQGQLAQALLFCGPRGVGKTSCARILAKQINQSDPSVTSENDFAFNIFELDAASNNSVDDIRKINDQVRIPPQVGSHKIYIIDEAHMLSNQAFNAFLKTLEEPPKHVIFILATTEKNKIIPTVLSRCQVYDFKRISVSDIQTYLVKIAKDRNLIFEESALYLIAQKAEGALRDALSIFDRMVSFTQGNLNAKAVADNLNLLDHQTYIELGKILFKNQISEALRAYDDLLKRGIDPLQFIKGLGDFYRNLMLAKDPNTLALMEVGEDIKAHFQEESKQHSTAYILDAIALINSFEASYKNITNKRVHTELALMQLASLHFDGEKKKDFIIPASQLKEKSAKKSILDTKEPTPKESSAQSEEEIQILVPESPINTLQDDFSQEEEQTAKGYHQDPQTPLVKEPPQGAVSGFSLSSIALKKAAQKKEQKETETENLPEENFENTALLKVWSNYISTLKKEGKLNIASIMEMNSPEVEAGTKIHFTVANALNKVELMQEKERLLPFLRKELNHYKIDIHLNIAETLQEDAVYTPQEKYQYLLKINPTLDTLREKFDLDF